MIQPHSIIITVGPSNCGKTYWCKNYLIPTLETVEEQLGRKPIIQYLNTDDIRREILAEDLDKMTNKMSWASHAAFQLLWAKCRAFLQWPVNCDFLIIDSTALSETFFKEISQLKNDFNYNTHAFIFDYAKRKEYFGKEGGNNKVTARHVDALKTKILPSIKKLKLSKHEKITSQDFENFEINIDVEKFDLLKKCQGDPETRYTVIGDIHGCFDEFKELLEKNEFVIENGKVSHEDQKIILLGDYVDKGPQVTETIEFIYNNLDIMTIVVGNHENWVYKALKGEIEQDETYETLKNELFETTLLLENNEELREKFFHIFENSLPFFQTEHGIITHAPCENRNLGKVDNISMRNQRNLRYIKRNDYESDFDFNKALFNELNWLQNESTKNHPLHIFGHISNVGIYFIGNKVFLDTGCVNGGKLSSITLQYGKNFLTHVPSKQGRKFIANIANGRIFHIDLNSLETKEQTRIKYLAKDKVNFISGTTSPSSKDKELGELENLHTAFDQYKSQGIDKITIQPKYMGSRCNIYLHKDPTKSYSTTRSGYLMRPDVDMTKIYNDLREKHSDWFDKEGVEVAILDGELLPWVALGKNLVENTYGQTYIGTKTELDALKQTNFYELLQNSMSDFSNSGFLEMNKEKRKDNFPQHKIAHYSALEQYIPEHIDENKSIELLENYKKQIDLFGKDGELEFKAFSILKWIYTDGKEKLFFNENNHEIFSMINSDLSIVVDINNPDDIEKAQNFWNDITKNQQMEGVVVKPLYVVQGVVPFLKVRNENYLSLIYGWDYKKPSKFEKLMKKKSTRKKLITSLVEWELGQKMLEIPYNKIGIENDDWISIVAAFIHEEKSEADLDPRL